MNRQILLYLILIAFISSPASAFDGNRKGFVLGGGLGIAPQGQWNSNYFGRDQSGIGPGLTLIIGGAFNEANMLVYEINMMGYSTERDSRIIAQGFSGPVWYTYIGDTGRSFFMTIGLGVYVFTKKDFKTNDPGFGMLLGCGYEFARHWQIGGYYSCGHISVRLRT